MNWAAGILQALALAGGPVRGVAQIGGIRIVRSNSPTTGALLVFDARKALSGRGLDLPLEHGCGADTAQPATVGRHPGADQPDPEP